ncbi:hypothetical protein A0H81_04560 [Grifola frondosa]|uniref:Uncharacterized protein n=1 Tax=Grifola frondosa TaxID=5627 RepID=A0A1C7MFG7_GRIFR|nr:hypothetical protein A0H81_04560 [Grifola frondosa]
MLLRERGFADNCLIDAKSTESGGGRQSAPAAFGGSTLVPCGTRISSWTRADASMGMVRTIPRCRPRARH